MKCPFCTGSKIKVIDTRNSNDLEAIRRRRKCLRCGRRFTTYERIEDFGLTVIKRDGRKEKFDKNKIRIGIQKACKNRSVSIEKINKIVSAIEGKIKSYKKSEIKSSAIGELVMKKLRKVDEVAYLRFASVYKSFNNLQSFEKEIRGLKK